MDSFETKVSAALGSWEPGTVFLAAVSGGADSTAMLNALVSLRDAAPAAFTLHCLHVEHGLRPAAESLGDAAFVKQLCEQLNVPCKIVSIPPGKIAAAARQRGIGIEAAARLYRHREWNREARSIGAERILVAHTHSDLLETVLMRILRGSGPAGLAAMRQRRGRILRPLLALRRADVLAYLNERKIPFRTDATNADTRFLRNRIRNQLIPCLNELFPRWEKNLSALAETQGLTAEFLKAEGRARVPWKQVSLEQVPLEQGANGGELLQGRCTELRTSAGDFFSAPEIIREESLFLGIDMLGKKPLAKGRVKQSTVKRSVLRQFSMGKSSAADLGAYRLRKDGGAVILSRGNGNTNQNVAEEGFGLLINEPGLYKLNGIAVEVFSSRKGESAGFYGALPLVLRRSFRGDFIVKAGRRLRAADQGKELSGAVPISAVDREGIAAFIILENGNVRIETAGFKTAERVFCFTVIKENTGGIDVQRYE
jgi:tRNA(Ile)-lysidine synthase